MKTLKKMNSFKTPLSSPQGHFFEKITKTKYTIKANHLIYAIQQNFTKD